MAVITRVVKTLWPGVGKDVQEIVRSCASRRRTVPFLNAVYNRISPQKKHRFYARFGRVFYGSRAEPAKWRIDFCGREIIVPLGGDASWLRWEAALAVLGHEPEIKELYADLVRRRAPRLTVLDVGANLGLHSIMFLVHGCPVISFEPNASCHGYFEDLCAANAVTPDIVPLGLSDRAGTTTLFFPAQETWLGTIVDSVKESLAARSDGTAVPITLTTLDAFMAGRNTVPDVIKIDAEGHELSVLRGALETLTVHKPLVIFESWPGMRDRATLFDLLTSRGYSVYGLTVESRSRIATTVDFEGSTLANFAAAHPSADLAQVFRG